MTQELRSDLAAFALLLEAEWYNGNLDEKAYERLNTDLTGIVAKHDLSFLSTSADHSADQPTEEGAG